MKTKGAETWMVQLLLISRIVIVTVAIFLALIIWKRNTNNLLNSVEKLSRENPNIDLLERGITTLYQAENDFRFYLVNYDRRYFNEYSNNLNSVSEIIDTLQNSINNRGYIAKIGVSLTTKANISNIVIRLKKLTDSLLTVAGEWDTMGIHRAQVPAFDIRKIQNFQRISSIDSIVDTASIKKKGFLGKVKSLFKEDDTPQTKGIIVKRTVESNDTDIETNLKATPEYALLKDIHSYYIDKIDSYTDGRNKLNIKEKELASINAQLIYEIVNILRQVKDAEILQTKAIKDEAILSGEQSARSISIIAAFSILIAALFFFLIIYYLGRIKTSTKLLEVEKNKALNLAQQKSRFLSSMSHEIRAPLNNILGFAEQLKNVPDKNYDKYLIAIHTSAELMLSTVNQILDISTLDSGKMSFNKDIFSPYKTIEIAADTMALRAREKKLMLNLHLPVNENFMVCGDKFRLKQVIVNLLDNAVKYTDKGEINVSANFITKAEGYVAYIEIADTGMGIPGERIDDIFNEFERLDENENRRWKPGTGLGLPIVRKVIEQQGGKVYVKETNKKGTVIAIELPYEKPLVETVPVSETAKVHKIPAGKTILLADDDSFSVLLITTICKRHNIMVLSAENGQIALEMALQNHVDLIITDINMPVFSGLEFTRELRTMPKIASIPVIAFTANVMSDEVQQMKEAGFNEILFKPFRESEFIKKISLFLQ